MPPSHLLRAFLVGMALAAAPPVNAQNAGQIAAVRNGANCPR